MIARYTRPELGRIWSDANKYQCWLTVEVAASQALAKFGLVPQSARRHHPRQGRLHCRSHQRDRSRSPSRRHRLHHHRRRAHRRPRSLPLAPLRTHQHRRRRHCAIAPAQRSFCHHPRRHRRSLRNPQEARNRVQAQPHHRPHPRHPTPNPPPLASSCSSGTPRCSATSPASTPQPEDLRVGKLSGAVGTFGHLKPEHRRSNL